jgi:hypothetical protein
MIIRGGTTDEFRELFGAPLRTAKLRVAEVNGRIVGAGGYYQVGGIAHVFSKILGPVPKKTIVREFRRFMAEMRTPAVCIGSEESKKFLQYLGWHPVGHSEEGEIFYWEP